MQNSIIFLLAILTLGCSRSSGEQQAATSSAPLPPPVSSPKASASSPSALPAPPANVALETRLDPGTKRPVAWLTSPGIGLEERVAEVVEPHVCRLEEAAASGRVTCSTEPAKVQLSLERRGERLWLTPLGAEAREVASARGKPWRVAPGEASARELKGGACPSDAPAFDLPIRFVSYANLIERDASMSVVYTLRPSGDARILKLWKQAGGTGCSSKGTAEERQLTCKDTSDACTFRVEPGSLSYTCQGPPAYSGKMLLPCGARGQLVTSGHITPAVRYR